MRGRIIADSALPQVRLGLPVIGKVKIGKKSDKGYPMSLDYFIADGRYASLFHKTFGEAPSSIQIMFTDDDPSKVCDQRYEYRNDKGELVSYGDGEVFFFWNSREKVWVESHAKNYMQELASKMPNKKIRNGMFGWDIVLTIRFLIPMLRGIAGLWQLTTKGVESSIPNIVETFDCMKAERGFVRGVIFDLNVQFAKSQKADGSSRFPVVTIVPNESQDNIDKIRKALQPVNVLQLAKDEQEQKRLE